MPGCLLINPSAALNGKACRPSPPGFDTLLYAAHTSDVDVAGMGAAYANADYILETLPLKAGAVWLPIYAVSQSVNYTETHRPENGSVEGVLTFKINPYAGVGTTAQEQRSRALFLTDSLAQDNEGWVFLIRERGGVTRALGVSGRNLNPLRRADGIVDNLGTADADIPDKTLVFSGVFQQSAPIVVADYVAMPIAS